VGRICGKGKFQAWGERARGFWVEARELWMEFVGCSAGVAAGTPHTNDSSSISVCRRPGQDATTGNENVPKIIKK